ncbi:MAG: hypothetical protein CR967_05490 [Proteobacteria bacterium]|nr:MAG: hypothetical protein CR967_05490 [Pseudomonadota bacterium]
MANRFDENGKRVNPNIKAKNTLENDIKNILNSKDEMPKIVVAIKADPLPEQVIQSQGGVQIDENGNATYISNEKIISKEEFFAMLEKEQKQRDEIAKNRRKNPNLVEFIKRNGLENDELAKKSLRENLSYIELFVAKDRLRDFVNKNKDLIDGLGLVGTPANG